jgi:hypothetical protein
MGWKVQPVKLFGGFSVCTVLGKNKTKKSSGEKK